MDINTIRRENILILEKEMGAVDLYTRMGMSPTQYYNLRDGAKDSKTGRQRGMRPETARRFDEASGKPPGWLDVPHNEAQEAGPSTSPLGKPVAVVPLISSVRAGTWGCIDDHEPDTADTFAVRETRVGPHAFALRVEGDSMTCDGPRSFPEGTVLIVEPDRSPVAGDYVVAKDVENQRATFKRLTTDGSRWYLKPLNRDYPTIEIDDPAMRVIGVVVEFWTGGRL